MIQLPIFKRIKYFIILFAALHLLSCDASFGEKYTLGNLEIYFTKSIGKQYVEDTGKYFNEHGLIQDSKHSIQLSSDEKSFILKMVLNPDFKSLPESQKLNLELLEKDIRETVFDSAEFRIEVCNANFVPINKAP